MPVTPLHFGLNGSIALLFRKHLDLSSCIISNVILDIQPGLVLLFDYNYAVHGFSHTLLGSTLILVPTFLLYGIIVNYFRKQPKPILTYIIGAVIGEILHVILDSFVHSDVSLFFPFSFFSSQAQ